MHSSAAESFMGLGFFALGLVLLLILVILGVWVMYILNLQRCVDALRPEFRPNLPSGLLWLMLVPYLGLVVWLVGIILLSSALKREGEARQTTAFGDGGLVLGVVSCAASLFSAIPFLGMIFGVVGMVTWIMHWQKVKTFRRLLGESAPVVAAPAFPATVLMPAAPSAAPAPAPTAVPANPPASPVAGVDSEATLIGNSVEAAPARQAYLRGLAGPLANQDFPVGAGILLGRSAEANVVVGDPHVSNRHAWVGPMGDGLLLRDNQSTNGTFLNDLAHKVGETLLKEGDVVILGDQGKVSFQVTYR